VSVTPEQVDVTAYEAMDFLRSWNL
jgi:hypothetical protein